jgi:t-SNARE complex subunit (syntaxin)
MVDRLAELQTCQRETDTKAASHPELISYMSLFEPVQRGILLIKTNSQKIRQLQEKESFVVTEAAKKEIQKSLATLMRETTAVGKRLPLVLQEIKKGDEEEKRKHKDTVKQRMRENIFECQVSQVRKCWEDYIFVSQSCQKTVNDRDRRRVHYANPALSEEEVERILENGQADAVVRSAMMSEELKSVVRDIDARHQEILALERQVLEVYELFKDLALLTSLQQETIDSIDGHVRRAKTHVEKGNDSLEKAEKHQKAARKKKCYLLVGGAVALAAIVGPVAAVQAA